MWWYGILYVIMIYIYILQSDVYIHSSTLAIVHLSRLRGTWPKLLRGQAQMEGCHLLASWGRDDPQYFQLPDPWVHCFNRFASIQELNPKFAPKGELLGRLWWVMSHMSHMSIVLSRIVFTSSWRDFHWEELQDVVTCQLFVAALVDVLQADQ